MLLWSQDAGVEEKNSIGYFSCSEITFLWAQVKSCWQSQERHSRPVFNIIAALFNILAGAACHFLSPKIKREGWKKFVCVLTDRQGRAAASLTWKPDERQDDEVSQRETKRHTPVWKLYLIYCALISSGGHLMMWLLPSFFWPSSKSEQLFFFFFFRFKSGTHYTCSLL